MLFACGEQKKTESPAKVEPEKPSIDFRNMGHEITTLAQAELLKNVKSAIAEGGPSYAIEYCNVHATPLTDSISDKHNCTVSRVSIKNRNPKNKAIGREENILMNTFLESSLDGGQLKDTLIENDLMAIYYRPIMIGMPACLKCHGKKGDDIDEETLAAINQMYPDDKATNYRMGEFRGAWKVVFHKEN